MHSFTCFVSFERAHHTRTLVLPFVVAIWTTNVGYTYDGANLAAVYYNNYIYMYNYAKRNIV